MATASSPGSRVALVIGNAGYRFGPPLANPHNDSEGIGRTLARLGFSPVILHKDLGLIELGRALSDFQMRAENSEMAVVYFAGHGLQIEGQDYLVPIDAELQHVGRMSFETIPLSHVLPVVRGSKTLQLVILDACRDNPFAGHMRGLEGTRSLGLGLSNIEPGGNTLVAYAAKHGTKAKDGPLGTNSPYTEALLQHFETPDLEIRLLFGRVRDTVLQKTHKTQEPHLYGSLGGEEIYLKRSQSLHDPARDEADHAEAEARWREFNVDQSEDAELIEAWLAQYGGRAPLLARVARKRLADIAEKRQGQDEADWATAEAEDTLSGYERYVAAWPAGVGANAANGRRAALQDDAAWARAAALGTNEALQSYLSERPEGRYREEASTAIAAIATGREADKSDALPAAINAAWQRVHASLDPAVLEQFLQVHTVGEQADFARHRLAALKADLPKWRQAQSKNTAEGFKRFLADNPDNLFVADARERLRRFVKNSLLFAFISGIALCVSFALMYDFPYSSRQQSSHSGGELFTEFFYYLVLPAITFMAGTILVVGLFAFYSACKPLRIVRRG